MPTARRWISRSRLTGRFTTVSNNTENLANSAPGTVAVPEGCGEDRVQHFGTCLELIAEFGIATA
jgi:hypothetical protein